jgi:hypothetical protein
MRLLIYLLAMLTGFSAAEAARPVSAAPASVDAAVGQAYASAAVNVVQKSQVLQLSSATVSAAPSVELSVIDVFSAVAPKTPVLLHDVILG